MFKLVFASRPASKALLPNALVSKLADPDALALATREGADRGTYVNCLKASRTRLRLCLRSSLFPLPAFDVA